MMAGEKQTTLLELDADVAKLLAKSRQARDQVTSDLRAMQEAGQRSPAEREVAGTLEAFGFSAEESAAFAAKAETERVLLGKSAAAHEDLSRKTQLTKRDLRDLVGGLDLLNPQLGVMARMALQAREAIGAAFTPGAATLVQFGAAAAGVVVIIEAIVEKLEQAAAQARAFAEQQERIRAAGVEVEKTVSAELGRLGKGSEEAFTAATGLAKGLEARGFEPSTAAQAAAAAVDEDGGMLIERDDLPLLAAAIESGQVEVGGKTPRGQRRNITKARRFLDRNRDRLRASARAYTRPAVREGERAKHGSPTDVSAILQGELGLSKEEADAQARDLSEVATRGPEVIMREGFESEGFIERFNQDYNIGLYRMIGRGTSERQERIQRAQERGRVIAQVSSRRQANVDEIAGPGGFGADPAIIQRLDRLIEISERGVKNGSQPMRVDVNVNGKAPVPQTKTGTRRAVP